VFDSCFGAVFAAWLFTLFPFVYALSCIRFRPGVALNGGVSGRWTHRRQIAAFFEVSGSAHTAAEFVCEDAIAGYEELIDSTCAERGPRHVALVIPTLDRIAGAERQVMLIARGLRARGWQVSVVALSGRGGAAAQELRAAGVGFLSLGMGKWLADPRGWLRFILWLRRARPDVVHAHLAHAAWLARGARLFAPVPVVIDTLHSSSTGTVWWRLGYRLSRRLSDRVTAVSAAVAGSHLAAKVVRKKDLTVLHNGVDLDDWHPDEETRAAVRRETGLENQFLWIAVGRLDKVKDYPTLLKAMASLPKSSRLVIAGTGPLLSSLSHLSSRLNLAGRVRFLGFEPNMKRWFQAADGFVLASRWEGLPMALLEAAACELPSVATDVPGVHEVLEDGETGVLVPAMDVSALAWAMNAIMQAPPEERRAIGVRARESVAMQYNLTSAIVRWEELYDYLLRKKSNPIGDHGRAAPKAQCAAATGQTPSS
jgi:glycosyltransferase involved in cell wall biosynthesis